MILNKEVTMLSVKELAQTKILSEYSIRLLLKQNKLPAIYIGNKALINYEKTVHMLQNLEAKSNMEASDIA